MLGLENDEEILKLCLFIVVREKIKLGDFLTSPEKFT